MKANNLIQLTLLLMTHGALAIAAEPAAAAQERDILDVALEQPLGATINGQPVRFGDPDLDSAEIHLRDYLPRPWTTTRIDALYRAAYTRLGESLQQTNINPQDYVFDEWMTLVEELGAILAASRDPRAALALGQVLETPGNAVLNCRLSDTFLKYFGSDASYRRPPAKEMVARVVRGCGDRPEDAHQWWLLNQHEVEQRAAAITATLPPCPDCEQEALAAIDQLRIRLHDSAPTLHLTIQGSGVPQNVYVHYIVRPISGQSGGTSSGTSTSFSSPDIRLRIPANLLGRGDMRAAGVVMSPGYRTVPFELDHINGARVVPVTLVPVESKTLTGTITLPGNAPRRFGLRANLWVDRTNDPADVFSHSGTLLQNIAQATVDQDGHFSITLPDLTQDPVLSSPENRYQLAALYSNWVLLPDVIALDHSPGAPLNIIVAPRPGSPASTSANPGPPMPVTGRVIDANGRPAAAAQVVIVNSDRLRSLQCPEVGECFPVLQASGMARAVGVAASDGSFTLQVPVGLMPNDSVWAEGRDAGGQSIRTSWPISPNRSLPTALLGDVRLNQRMDFTVVVRGEGRPLEGVEVEFEYLGTKRTDATGAAAVHRQVSGDTGASLYGMRFTVRAEGFASEAWDGGIAAGTTTRVVDLERDVVQRGRVVDASGRALGNVTVQAHAVARPEYGKLHDPFPDARTGSVRTDDTGAFTLRGLHGGRQYRLAVVSADGALTDGERIVTAGGAAVDIVVPTSGRN